MGTMDRRTPSAGPAARRLTARQLTVWRSLMDTMEELSRRLTAHLQQVGLSAGDYLMMLTLSEAEGHRLRSPELADAIGWQRSRLSHHRPPSGRSRSAVSKGRPPPRGGPAGMSKSSPPGSPTDASPFTKATS
jgi:hypothetical protein